MFKRVLVANRGEIAVRVIRALHELGVEAVAVYSTADADALHVGSPTAQCGSARRPSAQSYLSIPAIIAAADDDRLRGGASRLRLPLRERRLRRARARSTTSSSSGRPPR